MIIQKTGLLQRVRIVLTALVMVTGIGTTLMSMKAADDFTYQVSETSGGQNWRVENDVTNRVENPYICDKSAPLMCTVNYGQQLQNGNLIPKNAVTGHETGLFIPD